VLGAASAIVALYLLLPAAAGLGDTWERLSRGSPWWLAAAAALEVMSFASYMAYFRAVFAPLSPAVDWRASYRITMAGVMATRVLAVAGAGGIALTAWALRATGLRRRDVAAGIATFFVILYGIFMAALVVFGLGLHAGVFAGPDPWALTVLPAAFGGLVIVTVILIAARSRDLDRVASRLGASSGRPRARRWLAAVPATISSGVRGALALVRRGDPGLLGAPGWFAFDIAVLWACLSAFGEPPSIPVLIAAYFVGMIANTLPVPGGIGAVDGGIIGALIGFGVEPGLAIVGVLSYRVFSFWLPIVPGAVAYVQLLRRGGASRAPSDADRPRRKAPGATEAFGDR
jgi:uncharacterized membrane protein YbhN (UPF0104 family)